MPFAVQMKSFMAMSMIQSRSEIRTLMAGAKGDRWVAGEIRHNRDLIREMCQGLNSPYALCTLKNPFRTPRKAPSELMAEVRRLRGGDPHARFRCLASIFQGSADVPRPTKAAVEWKYVRTALRSTRL
jgi:hypothetical protein